MNGKEFDLIFLIVFASSTFFVFLVDELNKSFGAFLYNTLLNIFSSEEMNRLQHYFL